MTGSELELLLPRFLTGLDAGAAARWPVRRGANGAGGVILSSIPQGLKPKLIFGSLTARVNSRLFT